MKSLKQVPGLGKGRLQYLTEDKYNEIVSCVTEFPTLSSKERKAKYSQGHVWNKKYKVLSVGNSRELILNPDYKRAERRERERMKRGAKERLTH